MRYLVAGTVACSCLVMTSSARAGDPRYGLSGGLIAITTEAGTEQHVAIDCKRAYAVAQSGAHLFVACGDEGVATYTLNDPRKPVLTGRVLPADGPCVWLTSEGACMIAKPVILIPSPPPAQPLEVPPLEEKVRYSEGLFIGGLATVGFGAAMMVVGLGGLMSTFCFISCSSSQESTTGAFGALMFAGMATAGAIGLPIAIVGGHRVRRVTASIGPTGGALRVTF